MFDIINIKKIYKKKRGFYTPLLAAHLIPSRDLASDEVRGFLHGTTTNPNLHKTRTVIFVYPGPHGTVTWKPVFLV